MGFETGSDNEKIDDLQKQFDDIIDSQLTSVGGNENLSIDSTLGARNDASGDAGGVRSNQPIVHNITDVDAEGVPTGVFDKINLISSMIIVDHTSTPMDLRFIQGPAKEGSKIIITVEKDSTLVIKTGGNILTSSDITITDTEFFILVKHSFAETGVIGGAYKILKIGTGGGGVSFPIRPPIQDEGTIGSITQIFDLSISTGHVLKFTANGDVDIVFQNYPSSGDQQEWEVEITQDGTGGHTITWPAEVTNPPVLDTTANSISVVVFRTNDGGATVRVGNTVTTTGSGGGDVTGPVSSTDNAISRFDGVTGKIIQNSGITIDDSNNMAGVAGIDLDGVSATIQGVQTLDFFQSGHSIISVSGELQYNVADIDAHKFFANSVEIARFTEESAGVYRLDMLDHTIKDAKDIRFDVNASFAGPGAVPVIGYDNGTAELRNNAPDNAKHIWTTNNTELMGLTESQLTFLDGLKIQANPNGTNPGISVGAFAGDPASTTNGDLWYNSTTDKLRTKENGVDVDVVGAGTGFATTELDNLGVTSINADMIPQAGKLLGTDANPWSDTTSNKFTLGTDGTFAASDNAIIADATLGMEFNTPSGDRYGFFFANTVQWTMSATTLTGSTANLNFGIINENLTFNSSASDPTLNGQFSRNGNELGLQIENFAVRNDTSVTSEFSELSLIKVDATPLIGENIGRLQFGIDDSGTVVNYAGVYAEIKEVTDSGILQLVARSNNGQNTIGIQIEGDDDITRTYATVNAKIDSDLLWGVEDGAGGTFRIGPDTSAGASIELGIVVQDNVFYTVGTSGSLVMPSHSTTIPPTASELDGDFGTHEGAMGFSRPVTTTNDAGKLFIRNSDNSWFMFTSVLRIT